MTCYHTDQRQLIQRQDFYKIVLYLTINYWGTSRYISWATCSVNGIDMKFSWRFADTSQMHVGYFNSQVGVMGDIWRRAWRNSEKLLFPVARLIAQFACNHDQAAKITRNNPVHDAFLSVSYLGLTPRALIFFGEAEAAIHRLNFLCMYLPSVTNHCLHVRRPFYPFIFPFDGIIYDPNRNIFLIFDAANGLLKRL